EPPFATPGRCASANPGLSYGNARAHPVKGAGARIASALPADASYAWQSGCVRAAMRIRFRLAIGLPIMRLGLLSGFPLHAFSPQSQDRSSIAAAATVRGRF